MIQYIRNIVVISLLFFTITTQAQKTDSHIIGHVTSNGEHLPFATILLEGTSIGTATDETGHFRMINIPAGEYKVKAQAVGYISQSRAIKLELGKTVELKFDLKEDLIGLEQVVISANKNEQNRKDAISVVNSITPKIFESTQSSLVAEALNFAPGLRLENNCQNCGFTQIRMNGMEGSYSQILINSRPIMSGLAGVYGLELFPTNMIERIEVVRGGGSALFGSNAIAGTINLITKDPIRSGFEVGTNSLLVGAGMGNDVVPAMENSVNFNASVVDHEAKGGVTAFGYVRNRSQFDANNDGYSESSTIKNTTLGVKAFHRTGKRGKVTIDYFHIEEDRRGGDAFDKPLHAANTAEAVNHNIHSGSFNFDQLFKLYNKLSVYGAVQYVDRDAYYGAEQDLSAYGNSKDLSYSVGSQLNLFYDNLLFAPGTIVSGIESNGGSLYDEKLGYMDEEGNIKANLPIADQRSNTTGAFAQAEWDLDRFKANIGVRADYYQVEDVLGNAAKNTGLVISPRISAKYNIREYLSVRGSYAQGYKAPQIYDEDLHIEVSGLHKVIHKNDPNLKQEESHSYMLSFDFDKPIAGIQSQFLVEGFYTQLVNAFAPDYSEPNEAGEITFTRVNATDGAFVRGINMEWTLAPSSKIMTRAGFTAQQSMFKKAQEDFNEKRFFRSPDSYGFLTIDYDFAKNFCLMATANYTGSMLVPHFGLDVLSADELNTILLEDGTSAYTEAFNTNEINKAEIKAGNVIEGEELYQSKHFIDLGLKLTYDIKLNGSTLQLNGGVKNILNAYQTNFDRGLYRDPGFMYGPTQPRTIFFGIKFSNI